MFNIPANNYQTIPLNIPQKQRFHLQHDRSL